MSDEHPPFVDFISCLQTELGSNYTVAVVNDDVVDGHIPLRLSKIMSMFLKLTGSHMEAEVTGKYEEPRSRLQIRNAMQIPR